MITTDECDDNVSADELIITSRDQSKPIRFGNIYEYTIIEKKRR